MAVVWVPALYRDLTGGATTVSVPGGTLREVIANLEARFPGMQERLFREGEERLRPGIAVVVDGETVRDRASVLRRPLAETSEVHFLPAISGG